MQPFATSFQFRVTFELGPDAVDTRFQSVSGLGVSYGTETIRQGGENRFAYELPQRTQYTDLVLRRALVTDSALVEWCRATFEDYRFRPAAVTVQLLDPAGEPLRVWNVYHAWPKQWQLADLNAEQNGLALETLTLGYRHFKIA